jgi:predicted DNA-binding protein (UPF0251 family)
MADQYKHGTRVAKLTAREVAAIRLQYQAGKHSQYAIAKQYGVTQTTVWGIVNGRDWQRHASEADQGSD